MENQGDEETRIRGTARRRRLALFPLPLQGHLNPMLQLAGILHSRGFSVAIIHTRFNSPLKSNYPHFTFHPIADGLSERQVSTTAAADLLKMLQVQDTCASGLRDCLGELLMSEEPVACLIVDSWWLSSKSVADSFGLPRMVLRTGSVTSFLGFSALVLLQENGYLQESQPEEAVPELPPLQIRDLPTLKPHDSQGRYSFIVAMIEQFKTSSGIIWNSFEELEPPSMTKFRRDFPVPSFPVGPFQKNFPASSSSLLPPDRSCISWLDAQHPKSVLYVSFGSIAAIDEGQFLEMAWGLESSAQPFLWVIRPGLVGGWEWPGPLPSGFMERTGGRGHVVKWAPQQEVLGHGAIGGFWTHSGWNSTMESICEGVPMMCSPFFGDQMTNARYVKDVWRNGLVFEPDEMKRGEVEETIRRLMAEKEGEDMRERALWLKEKVELSLSQGGSSHHSLESLVTYILSF
ncbi:UDP-glycosyltransferase 76B1-like isoform X3 [Diospyros lotus]|uniref:UDP-glycosyltransferase 76B1-like isoform X3 n=1 Tax=Diospyros lotus TaxID=55363 RepID=UPI002250D049|nr:UDP-glycosyltransferase 76B1-like isoform X3 [Diospyros lotus]